MKYTTTAAIALVMAVVLSFIPPATMHAQGVSFGGGNDFISGHFRVDLPSIYNSINYKLDIKAETLPSSSSLSLFTTGWLSVNVNSNGDNQGFMQVGLIAQPDGLRWFAYSYAGVQCVVDP